MLIMKSASPKPISMASMVRLLGPIGEHSITKKSLAAGASKKTQRWDNSN